MKLSNIAVRKPVFTVMMVLALLVLGYTSFNRMNVDLFPEIDFPFVIVSTEYPGASAEAVETDVTKKIEDAVNPIEGLKHITSESQEGFSLVLAEFVLEKDGKLAAQEAREKVAQIRDELPADIEEPVIARFDPASQPIISLTVSGTRPLRDITTFIKDDIKKRLEAIPGVGSVTLVGGYEREINIYLDIDQMESYEITLDKVRGALQTANMEIPGGRVNENNMEYVVRTMGKLTSVSQFESLVIDNPRGQPVYLRDIAQVVDGIEERRSLSRVDGEDAITLNISRQSGANTVDIANRVRAEVSEIRETLPPDMEINTIVDNATYIEDSIAEIMTNILIGGTLAILVVFLFLADLRPTIITAIALPTSIIATFTFMNSLGFTLNMMSLMGLSLAVGFLIDDAIVVIENIYRHLDEGKPPRQAALAATKEIGFAVMTTTMSIVVVFLPVAFMEGIVGRFFYQFGVTITFAVLISLFIAFSLTPMLSSRFLVRKGAVPEPPKDFFMLSLWQLYRRILKLFDKFDRQIDRLRNVYRASLAWSLRHRFLVMLTATIVFAAGMSIGALVGSEFLPASDRGEVHITMETPPGTDLETTSKRFREVEKILEGFEEVTLIFTTIGSGQNPVNEGRIFVKLTDMSERERSAGDLVDTVRTAIAVVPGIKYSLSTQEAEGGSEKPVEISIRGNDMEILTELTHEVQEIFRETPGTIDIDNTLEEGKPELRIIIDRDKANDLAVNVFGTASTIRGFIDGEVVTRYKEGDKEYDVRIRLKESDRAKSDDLERLLVASGKEVSGRRDFMVPLSYFADIVKASSIGKYNRYDRLPEVKVGSNVTGDAFAGSVTNEIMEKASALDLPPGYFINVSGTGEIMAESFANIGTALFLAVIFIFILLASQFESFFDPLSIMFSLPMSLVGAFVGLLIFGSSISIISLIGIILLMGLVTKNAILLVDFIKQNRRAGKSRTEAILTAGPIRMRPILMTAISTIFGMLPLALALGAGAEFRSPMARAVIGGLISSTLLTLIVVPVVYTIIDDIVARFMGHETIQPEVKEAADV